MTTTSYLGLHSTFVTLSPEAEQANAARDISRAHVDAPREPGGPSAGVRDPTCRIAEGHGSANRLTFSPPRWPASLKLYGHPIVSSHSTAILHW